MDVMDVNPKERPRIIFGKEMIAPKGRKWMFSQENIFEMEKSNLIRLNSKGTPQYKVGNQDFELLDSKWTDIPGYSSTTGFQTENSEKLLLRVIKTGSNDNDVILDFFLGSGTTTAVAHKINRKWIGVEMGDQFYDFCLPRMKEVLAVEGKNEPCGISKEVNWEGGGFFKYYELEQYEDALKKAVYNPLDKELENIDFSLSEKQAKVALDIDLKKETARFVFEKLYPDVDIVETISNLFGKKIKKISKDKVVFEDDIEIDLNNLDFDKWPSLKKLIYW